MPDPSPTDLPIRTEAAAPQPIGLGCWCLRVARSPLRYIRRNPYRVAAYLLLVLVLLTGASLVGVAVWFTHHLRQARKEVALGHNAVALRHLEKCRSVWPGHPEVMILSARVARRSAAWDEAEAILEDATRRHGETEALAFERLLLRAVSGDLRNVRPSLVARIRQGGPDAALAREALIAGLAYRFRLNEALAELEDWLAVEPQSVLALAYSGKLEEQRLNTEGAAEKYRRVLQLDPDHDDARLRLASLLVSDRRGGEAIEHLGVLRQRLPDHPEVAILWVKALALVGRTAESRTALEACLRDYPNYPAALAESGASALLDGDDPAAIEYFKRALALEPGNVTVRKQYTLALTRVGRHEEAAREQAVADRLAADFERITQLIAGPLQSRPQDPEVHHEIAQIALRAGQVREALRWFQSALEVDPDHGPTHRALANLYRDLENPILAARHRALAQKSKAASSPSQ